MNVVEPLIGTRFGNYEVQSLLGVGGMARVYLGYDHNLQRAVAIKVLTDSAAAEPGVAARFQQEARFIARLRHPQIVQVYDFGEVGGLAYMVQELLPGPTLEHELHDRIGRGSCFSRDEICSIVAELAAALDAAHAAGIIHRDVKPSNAMRNHHGQLVLTDFGIARLTQPNAAHTQAGMVIGTPDYISPEQAQGLPPTTASDIYALGVLTYELIGNQRPFTANTPMGVLLGHIQQPPPSLVALRPDLPPAAEAIVLRALAKEPSQRFASAGEFARILDVAWLASASLAIHSVPTTAWAAQGAAPTLPSTATTATHAVLANLPTQVVTPAQVVPSAPPVPVAAVAAAPARPRIPLLVILGGVLLLLLAGAVFATRGGDNSQTTVATMVAAGVVPTGQAAPQAIAVPTDAPTAPPVSPFDNLRALLQAGQIENNKDLLKRLDKAEAAVAAGNSQDATDQLRELRDAMAENEDTSADVRRAALDSIAQIAATYALTLDTPPPVQPAPENPGNGNGNENGNGKGKDKDK